MGRRLFAWTEGQNLRIPPTPQAYIGGRRGEKLPPHACAQGAGPEGCFCPNEQQGVDMQEGLVFYRCTCCDAFRKGVTLGD